MAAASNKPARAFIYARFSPRAKAAECLSCDVQIADLRARAEQLGYEVDDDCIFRDDALSGASLKKRVGFSEMMNRIRRGDVLMIRDYKRLARRTLDAFQVVTKLNVKGVRLYSLEDGEYDPNDTGKLIAFGVKAILAEVERIESGRKTKAKMLAHQAAGRLMSKEPQYGKMIDPDNPKRTLPCPKELATIARLLELHASGLSQRKIGEQLEAEGMLFRSRPWGHKTIGRILKRAAAS